MGQAQLPWWDGWERGVNPGRAPGGVNRRVKLKLRQSHA